MAIRRRSTRRRVPRRRVAKSRRRVRVRRGRRSGRNALRASSANNKKVKLTLYTPQIQMPDLNGSLPGQPGKAYGGQITFNISQFPRAVAFQALYQAYRITSVYVEFLPTANVAFNQGQFGPAPAAPTDGPNWSAPIPYGMAIPWSGLPIAAASWPTTMTENFFSNMGCPEKPFTHALHVAQKPVVYAPAISYPAGVVTSLLSTMMPKKSPWITSFDQTGALDTTKHFGPLYRFQAQPTGIGHSAQQNVVGYYRLKVNIEFIKPTLVPPPA